MVDDWRQFFYFYPRPPRGGRRFKSTKRTQTYEFLSTPSARRATRQRARLLDCGEISIHALREEGDPDAPAVSVARFGFLSTPSARRATGMRSGALNRSRNFYPRPPRGGRLYEVLLEIDDLLISIHALREEGDLRSDPKGTRNFLFLSTPSARRATILRGAQKQPLHISIHALREEGDVIATIIENTLLYFYPRPPRGGRPNILEK